MATGTTNSTGVALLGGIAASTYTLSASLTNYDSNTATSAGNGTIALTGLGSASITVYDKSTNSAAYTGTTPFAGGTVSVTFNSTTYNAVTDSSRVATFNNLPVSIYTFKVTAASYSNWIDTTAHKDITITVGSTASTVISVYGKGGAKVTVTDGSNVTISDATVRFYREGSEELMHLTTNAAGQITAGWALFTGTYNVKATKDGSTVTSSNFVVLPRQTTDVSVTF